MLHTLIMAGGGGTRFWPRSRQKRPKQFLTMVGDRSLLQQAVDRIESAVPPQQTWVITGAMYSAETARQLERLAHANDPAGVAAATRVLSQQLAVVSSQLSIKAAAMP